MSQLRRENTRSDHRTPPGPRPAEADDIEEKTTEREE